MNTQIRPTFISKGSISNGIFYIPPFFFVFSYSLLVQYSCLFIKLKREKKPHIRFFFFFSGNVNISVYEAKRGA